MPDVLRSIDSEAILRWSTHLLRIGVFLGIVGCIHLDARARQFAVRDAGNRITQAQLRTALKRDVQFGSQSPHEGLHAVHNVDDELIGYVATTSPQADHLIGFSGPTNLLIFFDPDLVIQEVHILWSRDTKEHVQAVTEDSKFWKQFTQLTWKDAARLRDVDAVSGATLTSLAIGQSIVHRLGGTVPALTFPDPLTAKDLQGVVENVHSLKPSTDISEALDLISPQGELLGTVLSTSPTADHLTGYQGPTQTLIVFDRDRRIVRIHVRSSFDNEPYVSYLNEDWSWPERFNGLSLQELADYDLEANQVEGVSGATFTSMAVARAIQQRARAVLSEQQPTAPTATTALSWDLMNVGAIVLVLFGTVLGITRLRGIKWLRNVYLLAVVGYLGVMQGDLLSMAMWVGWVQNGIPWQSATRLVLLSCVALTFPVLTKRNVYCSHLCAHGALQQLLRRRLRWQLHPRGPLRKCLTCVSPLLLAAVVLITMQNWNVSLVDLEPFDAWLPTISGWASISIALGGLVASLFVPLAYCRFGCPTGRLLEFLRRHACSDRLGWGDLFAVGLLFLAIGLLCS